LTLFFGKTIIVAYANITQKKETKKKEHMNIKRRKERKTPPVKTTVPGMRTFGHTPIYLIEAPDSYKCNAPKRFSSLRRQFT
jgi:hypothetical protein